MKATILALFPSSRRFERLNQPDLRFGKSLTLRRVRTMLNLDVYNAFNDNTMLTLNNNFASWQQPQSILTARFAKVSVQFDF